MKESRRLVGTVTPQQPTYAVFIDGGTGQLSTSPVLFFNIWEVTDEDGTYAQPLPVPFCCEFLNELEFDVEKKGNFLGLSLEEAPSPEEWQREIETYHREMRRAMARAKERAEARKNAA